MRFLEVTAKGDKLWEGGLPFIELSTGSRAGRVFLCDASRQFFVANWKLNCVVESYDQIRFMMISTLCTGYYDPFTHT